MSLSMQSATIFVRRKPASKSKTQAQVSVSALHDARGKLLSHQSLLASIKELGLETSEEQVVWFSQTSHDFIIIDGDAALNAAFRQATAASTDLNLWIIPGTGKLRSERLLRIMTDLHQNVSLPPPSLSVLSPTKMERAKLQQTSYQTLRGKTPTS